MISRSSKLTHAPIFYSKWAELPQGHAAETQK